MMDEVKNPNITYKTYSTLDHYFQNSQGNNQSSSVIKDIQDWYTGINKQK